MIVGDGVPLKILLLNVNHLDHDGSRLSSLSPLEGSSMIWWLASRCPEHIRSLLVLLLLWLIVLLRGGALWLSAWLFIVFVAVVELLAFTKSSI